MNPSENQPDQEPNEPTNQPEPSETSVSSEVKPPELKPPEQPSAESEQPESETVQPVTQSGPESKKGGLLGKLLWLVLGLAVVAGVAYGVHAIWKPADAPSASTTKTKKDIPKLTVGVISGSFALYPTDATEAYNLSLNNQIFEGLVAYQDNTKIVPNLAKGWSNPDKSTWDFDLKRDVTFHNGHTLTAADVVYSLKLEAKDKNLGDVYANTIKDVKALNDYKVEITTTAPDPFLLNKLTFLFVLDSKAPGATDAKNGTGPYELKPGSKPTADAYDLVAYDQYHGGHVSTRQLSFKSEADDVAAGADLKSGKINLVGEFSENNPSTLKGQSYHKQVVNDPAITFMAINSQAPGPLQKKSVREALRYSIDTPQLIKNLNIAAQPASQLVTQAIPGYNPNLTTPKADVAKAKKMLADAGYPNGVSLTLNVTATSLPVAQEVAKQAQAAGFTITVKQYDAFSKFIGDVIDGKIQLAVLSYSSDVLDSSDVFSQVIQNTGNYKSATLDSYLEQAGSTLDQTQRLQVLQKTSKYLVDDVAAIPLVNRQRIWASDKHYIFQFEDIAATPGIYFWKAYLNE